MNVDYNPRPAIYASWYPAIREIAIRHGYTACIHGSLLNDMDIVLVPWEQKVSDPVIMLLEMEHVTGAQLIYFHPVNVGGDLGYVPVLYPKVLDIPKEPTPHGRESWGLQINDTMYIDIAITPSVL